MGHTWWLMEDFCPLSVCLLEVLWGHWEQLQATSTLVPYPSLGSWRGPKTSVKWCLSEPPRIPAPSDKAHPQLTRRMWADLTTSLLHTGPL